MYNTYDIIHIYIYENVIEIYTLQNNEWEI